MTGFGSRTEQYGNKLNKMAKAKLSEESISNYFTKSRFQKVLQKINFLNKFTDKKEEPEKKKKVLLFKAEVLIRDSKFPAALKALDEVLKIDTNDITANYQKALCLFVLKRNNEALSYIDAAIEGNRKRKTTISGHELGRTQAKDTAPIKNNDNFNFVVLKAGILCSLGSPGYGQWLKKAEQIDPQRAEAFMKNHFKELKQLRST